MIHIVKGFGSVNKREVDVFLELYCFFDNPMYVGNLISGSSAFSKPSLNIWKFQFTSCWSLAWRILSITLLACEMRKNNFYLTWLREHEMHMIYMIYKVWELVRLPRKKRADREHSVLGGILKKKFWGCVRSYQRRKTKPRENIS